MRSGERKLLADLRSTRTMQFVSGQFDPGLTGARLRVAGMSVQDSFRSRGAPMFTAEVRRLLDDMRRGPGLEPHKQKSRWEVSVRSTCSWWWTRCDHEALTAAPCSGWVGAENDLG